MKVDIRSSGLSGAQVRELAATVRTAFRDVAHRIACIVVSVSIQAQKKHAARNCMVEVHMADGHVELVEERQRRLGAALRRAVQRAWRAATRWMARQFPTRPALPLPRRELLPLPSRPSTGSGK
ncbi:hypothetical protein [Ramlibacter sp. AN1133]|uniref:hypothetical protein n=1 Tax=Ramlibacter sp. AN1133 TaxID=3133429 RepID=UPI0030BACD53